MELKVPAPVFPRKRPRHPRESGDLLRCATYSEMDPGFGGMTTGLVPVVRAAVDPATDAPRSRVAHLAAGREVGGVVDGVAHVGRLG